jgi:hypothetical protein
LDHIRGKTTIIYREIWVFPYLRGIFTFIFPTS